MTGKEERRTIIERLESTLILTFWACSAQVAVAAAVEPVARWGAAFCWTPIGGLASLFVP